jgi:hypothetical protein
LKNHYELSKAGDYCKIFFRTGDYFLIDADDLEIVAQRTWSLGKRGYPVSHTSRKSAEGHKTETLHRYLLRPQNGFDVDHISGNKLDNRRNNLRICSHQQNMFNQRRRITNTTGYPGVSYQKSAGKYEAYINRDGKKIHLGLFMSLKEAIIARQCAADNLYGEFANKNLGGDAIEEAEAV